MKQIKDIITKPSQAVRAMINGLRKQSMREDFVIEMATYGEELEGICYGCAATCTVQEIANKNLTAATIRDGRHGAALGIGKIENFEFIINSLRKGFPQELFIYFDCIEEYRGKEYEDSLPYLTSHDWRQNLPDYEKFAAYLESINL